MVTSFDTYSGDWSDLQERQNMADEKDVPNKVSMHRVYATSRPSPQTRAARGSTLHRRLHLDTGASGGLSDQVLGHQTG